MSNISIWPIDKALSGATTPDLSGPGSNGDKEVVFISQSSSITGASPSDCSYPSAEMQSVYSTAPADWAAEKIILKTVPKNKAKNVSGVKCES